MREISNDELNQVAGGVSLPRGIIKQIDDTDIKFHPVPYARDATPSVPAMQCETSPDTTPAPAHTETSSPTSTRPGRLNDGRRSLKPMRYFMHFQKNVSD